MAAQSGKGTMAAVLGLTEVELKPYLNEQVVMANLNSKTQIVVSGSNDGINELCPAKAGHFFLHSIKGAI